MHVSKDLEGKVVTVQLARPLYVMDYVAHVRPTGSGNESYQEQFACEPVAHPSVSPDDSRPLLMDILLGVEVTEVFEDNIVVRTLTRAGHLVKKTVPSALILAIDQLVEFEPKMPPVFRKHEPKRIITP